MILAFLAAGAIALGALLLAVAALLGWGWWLWKQSATLEAIGRYYAMIDRTNELLNERVRRRIALISSLPADQRIALATIAPDAAADSAEAGKQSAMRRIMDEVADIASKASGKSDGEYGNVDLEHYGYTGDDTVARSHVGEQPVPEGTVEV